MSTFIVNRVSNTRPNTKTVFGFAIATALGVLLAVYPLTSLGAIAVGVTLYALFRWCRERMEWWQMLVLLALTPSLILNYGFDNLAVGAGGFKFPLSDVLMFLALILVTWRYGQSAIKNILLDPPAACLIALLLMTVCHLLFNIPRYGFYSVRDSSMFFEAVILILGVTWAQNPRNTEILKRWFFYALLINLVYSYTFIWGEKIQSMSPSFGVFHPVPLLGNYQQTALWLLLGVIYFLWIAPQVVRWPRWILTLLAAAQLGGLAILQVRAMYVGIGIIFLVLFLFGETKKLIGFASTIGWGVGALLALLLTVSALGIQLQGRMGPVTFAFVEEQVETVFAIGDANTRMSHEVDRADWYGEVWTRVTSSAANMVVGEGFGQALIDFVNEDGIPVRQPHNSSLTVLARLGFVGLSIWLLFIGLVLIRYVRFLRMRSASEEAHVTILWLFLCFLLYLVTASVQPTLEFSHGSMPFYFLLGLAIGIMGQREYSFNPQSFSVRTPRTMGA
jgi:O-Antigen ligase